MINDVKVLGIKEEEFPYKVGSWALPELGTNFTIQMIEELKPKNMSELIYFAGLSHKWFCAFTQKCVSNNTVNL